MLTFSEKRRDFKPEFLFNRRRECTPIQLYRPPRARFHSDQSRRDLQRKQTRIDELHDLQFFCIVFNIYTLVRPTDRPDRDVLRSAGGSRRQEPTCCRPTVTCKTAENHARPRSEPGERRKRQITRQ